jgi:hypothetical protein
MFWAHVRMLPRLEATAELRMVRAGGAPWLEKNEGATYLRELEHQARGKKLGGSKTQLASMGIVVNEV